MSFTYGPPSTPESRRPLPYNPLANHEGMIRFRGNWDDRKDFVGDVSPLRDKLRVLIQEALDKDAQKFARRIR